MPQEPGRFFLVLLMKDDEHRGHGVVFDEADVNDGPPKPEDKDEQQSATVADAKTFADVFESFSTVISTYRNFLQFTISVAPMISNAISERKIGEFAKSKGKVRNDLSTDDRCVYELEISTYRELKIHQDEVVSALHGAALLPDVMLIGLISAYDSFLSKLLKVVFSKHESIILTSEKTIKFSELSTFNSMEDARNALIEREIESVLRESHQDHFKWMENILSVKLRSDLQIFPKFIEICERRNLLTHTGGIISSKYIANCRENKCLPENLEIGKKLTVDAKYYSEAVDTVCEIGAKLCWVFWRKFLKDEREVADRSINEFCYDLIVRRQYSVAESILAFTAGVLKKGGNDSQRRTMIVNRANAIRLQKRESEAKKLLDSEDWSSVNDEFRISVAAIRGDLDKVASLIRKIGPNGRPNVEEYRTWPVFRGVRNDGRFKDAFKEVFGVPIVIPREAEILIPSQNSASSNEGDTRH